MEYRDEVYFQAIDYEKIPFRCRKCHEHGHLIIKCPLNTTTEKPKKNTRGKNKEASFDLMLDNKQTKSNIIKQAHPSKA